jgi:hypothetical protein
MASYHNILLTKRSATKQPAKKLLLLENIAQLLAQNSVPLSLVEQCFFNGDAGFLHLHNNSTRPTGSETACPILA